MSYKFYLVAVTGRGYKILARSGSLEDVLFIMKKRVAQSHSCAHIIRDGSTGKRYCYARFFDCYGNRL